MRIHFRINWSKTTLYNAGKRDFTIDWDYPYGFPRKGDGMCIPQFIEKTYSSEELFYYQNEQHTIFDWVEKVSRWEVFEVFWKMENDTPCVHITVEDQS